MRVWFRLFVILSFWFAGVPSGLALAEDLTLSGYTLVSKTRVGRTVFEYTYRADITNTASAVENVVAVLSSRTPHTIVVDADLHFGHVGAGAIITSTDTFTIRQYRRQRFSWAAMNWDISFDPVADNTRTVGPQGGTLTFPNGVVLDIPPNAVADNTDIEVTTISCDSADQLLAVPALQLNAKSCIAGFAAKPDGQTFTVPITATVPVRPLDPAEIPLRMEFNEAEGGYKIAQTDLVYHAAEGVIEISNLQHFSDVWIVAWLQAIENVCKFCVFYNSDEFGEICSGWANALWGNNQPTCCLLTGQERNNCASASNCSCCGETILKVTSAESDFSTGDCQILSSKVTVEFPGCADPGPFEHIITGLSTDCPEGTTLEINVDPSPLALTACESKQLQASILGRSPEGSIVIPPKRLEPIWESKNKPVADFIDLDGNVTLDGTVTGFREGSATVEAHISNDPNVKPGRGQVDVVSNIEDFCLQPDGMQSGCMRGSPGLAYMSLSPGDNELSAVAWAWDDSGALIDTSSTRWYTMDSSVVQFKGAASGQGVTLVAKGTGSTRVIGELKHDCESASALIDVTVDCPQILLRTDPESVNLGVGEERLLQAILLDDQGNPIDARNVEWSSADPAVVEVINPTGELTSIVGISRSSSLVGITATYYGSCQVKNYTTWVDVGCIDLEITPSVGVVAVDGFNLLNVKGIDSSGNIVDVNDVTWKSSNPNIAAVLPSEGPITALIGIATGSVAITASYDQGNCGISTAVAQMEVKDDIDLNGIWNTKVIEGGQNCTIVFPNGYETTLDWWADVMLRSHVSQIDANVTAFTTDYPLADPYTGVFLPSADPAFAPGGTLHLSIDSSNTLDCAKFFQTDGRQIVFGNPTCNFPSMRCEPKSCSETETIDAILSADRNSFVGISSHVFNATADAEVWNPIIKKWEQYPDSSITCEGGSDIEGIRGPQACGFTGKPIVEWVNTFGAECDGKKNAKEWCETFFPSEQPFDAWCGPGFSRVTCMYCETVE